MTFEEAIEHLDNVKEAEAKEYTDKFGHFDELAFELKNYRLWAMEVHKTIDKLQSTYAPKIKMTIEQRNKFMIFISEDEEFEDFWYCYGYGRKLYKEFSEKELMQAWLHPELIEVSDD